MIITGASAAYDPLLRGHIFFLALLNPDDAQYHRRATEINRVDRPIVTTVWVLIELADHLCAVRNRHLFGKVRAAVISDRRFLIQPAEQRLLERAIALYEDRPDKDWSLTDCTSFVRMRDGKLMDALTADHHFEQAGFQALLK